MNGKTVFQKTIIKTNEITSVEIKSFKGDGFISKDTIFYTLRLTDGKIVTVTLYHYGEEVEKEILETIRKSIV